MCKVHGHKVSTNMTPLLLLFLGTGLALKEETFPSLWGTAKLLCNSQKSLFLWKFRLFLPVLVTTLEGNMLSYKLLFTLLQYLISN